MPGKAQSTPALPPGTDPMFNVTCNDVVMGRGSGTQNHCGNVTYRKCVFLNKELYATSSKFDKLKISKAIVAAVREFGGHFVQADEKRGGLYFDIGDKRAWDKTSQALREGQAEVRDRLAQEDPDGVSKIAEYKQVISEQAFFAYACKMMESLYHPVDGESGIAACGQACPHAKRRQTLNQMGADPMRIHNAMQALAPPLLPPLHQYGNMQQPDPYNAGMITVTPNASAHPYQGNGNSMEPLPMNAPGLGENMGMYQPMPYSGMPGQGGTVISDTTSPSYNSYSNAQNSAQFAAPAPQQGSMDPLPYQPAASAVPKQMMLSNLSAGGSSMNGGSVFSLRKFCSGDFEVASDEGKALMDQLNEEVDSLIRRKSYGLIQIDTNEAFQDLVFEEDSMAMGVQNELSADSNQVKAPSQQTTQTNARTSSSSSSGKVSERTSGISQNTALSRGSSRMSGGLSFKDDVSLMNMSILSLNIDDDNDEHDSPIRSNSEETGKEGTTPKSIFKQSDPLLPKNVRKRETRVSFAAKGKNRSMNLTSMDDKSFNQLVDAISDPDADEEESESRQFSMSTGDLEASDADRSISRKMGFPMRKAVAKKFDKPPVEVEDKGSKAEMVSTLSINAEENLQSEGDFSKLAGQVQKPTSAATNNSLRVMDMSLSNVSALGMSAMSFDFDPEPDPDLES